MSLLIIGKMSNDEQIEDLLNRMEYLESENKHLKESLKRLISRINELIEVNDLTFPD